MQQPGPVKRFFASRWGLVALAALALFTLVGSFLYLGPFLAVVTFLLFGLAAPIYAGWKRPRRLAVVGIIVLLVAAPVTALLDAQSVRTPQAGASSSASSPYGNGGSVLDNAIVHPYTGAPGGIYEFTALLHPQFVPPNDSAPLWVELFVSTCPGATGNSSPYCGSGYPFVVANLTLPANLTATTAVGFNVTLNDSNLWWWQMAAVVQSPSGSSNLTWIYLDVPNGYGAVQGPVSGDFGSTFGILLFPILELILLYSGSVFFVALLLYSFFKSREARRKRQAEAATMSTTVAGATVPGGPAPTVAPPPAEKACPNCGAVVYPSESACWKCGKELGTTAVAKPESPSGPAPPSGGP